MASMKKAGTVTPNVVSFPTTAAATPAPIMFGSLIKERRKKAKLSQKDFAYLLWGEARFDSWILWLSQNFYFCGSFFDSLFVLAFFSVVIPIS